MDRLRRNLVRLAVVLGAAALAALVVTGLLWQTVGVDESAPPICSNSLGRTIDCDRPVWPRSLWLFAGLAVVGVLGVAVVDRRSRRTPVVHGS